MSVLPRLLTIFAVYLLAAVSPGPAVFYVMRAAVGSRRLGLRGALGVATGTAVWVCVAAFGLAAVLKRSPLLSAAIRAAGALYLLYLSWRLAQGARGPRAADDPAPHFSPRGAAGAYAQGLATNVTNPGTALFFTALLGLYHVESMPGAAQAAAYAGIPLLAVGWYSALALAFSSERLAGGYLRLRRPLDASLAVLFLALGVKLLLMVRA
jgi:threonine/homoserine/homoserine lactone efflux protein